MSSKLSFRECSKKLHYMRERLNDLNWEIRRYSGVSNFEYAILYNEEEICVGTLKEVSNYIDGLCRGYGINLDSSETFKTSAEPKIGVLNFLVGKDYESVTYGEKVGFYSRQDYFCKIRKVPTDNSYLITVTIKRYKLSMGSQTPTIISIPEFKLNTLLLKPLEIPYDKIRNILVQIDMQLYNLYQIYKERGNIEQAIEYLKTISDTQNILSPQTITELKKMYGPKSEGYYSKCRSLCNVEYRNLYEVLKNKSAYEILAA